MATDTELFWSRSWEGWAMGLRTRQRERGRGATVELVVIDLKRRHELVRVPMPTAVAREFALALSCAADVAEL